MKTTWRKLLSMLCALTLVISTVPIAVLAETADDAAAVAPQTQAEAYDTDAAAKDEAAAEPADAPDQAEGQQAAPAQPAAQTEAQQAAPAQPAAQTEAQQAAPAQPAAQTEAQQAAPAQPATQTNLPPAQPAAAQPAPAAENKTEPEKKPDQPQTPAAAAPAAEAGKTEEKASEPELPKADLEMKIGEEVSFNLSAGQAFTVRLKGKDGKMQVDAESDFALQVEIKDEKSDKAKTVKGEDGQPFQTIFGGRGGRTYLLTVQAVSSTAAGPVKLSVVRYVKPEEPEQKAEEDKPAEPEQKAEEDKPAEPEQKAEEDKPAEPEQKTEEDKPAEPEQKPEDEPAVAEEAQDKSEESTAVVIGGADGPTAILIKGAVSEEQTLVNQAITDESELDELVTKKMATSAENQDEEAETEAEEAANENTEEVEEPIDSEEAEGVTEETVEQTEAYELVGDSTTTPVAPVLKDITFNGGEVVVGERIRYSITGKNYTDTVADVIISVRLDENVGIKSASDSKLAKAVNHVLTWKLTDVPAGQTIRETFTVEVKEGAADEGKVSHGGSGLTIQIGDEEAVEASNTVENFVVADPPTMKETEPAEGTGTLDAVFVDDVIKYEISYKNYTSTAADIVIQNKLDANVEFVYASDGGKNSNGTVTWTLDDVEAGAEGTVLLTVQVLESALASNKGPGKVTNGGDSTTVQVGDGREFTLESVENPVHELPTHKETAPYKGTEDLGAVQVGTNITYEIGYTNYKSEAADIVITDKLDSYVDYVEADNKGVYDSKTKTVTWTLKSVKAGKQGTVKLTVKVKESALKSKNGPAKVVNGGSTASVKVGGDTAYTLDAIENQIPELPTMKETSPGKGTGTLKTTVAVGEQITYEITFTNYKSQNGKVVITNPLDKNVKFVSATGNGKKDSNGNVVWSFSNIKAGSTNKVTLRVMVLEAAKNAGSVTNKTTVQVGDDVAFELEEVTNPVSNKATAANTGDSFNPGLWTTLLIFSMLGAGWFGLKAQRGKK